MPAGKRLPWRRHLLAGLAFTLIFLLISVACDQHRSVTRQMGWQCTGVTDTQSPKFPHVEGIKLWYLDNPRYEELASGPSLCADLRSLARPDVAVTFDVWGSRLQGLHGYNLTGITAGEKHLRIYGSESGGFHGDAHFGNFDSREDEKKHPEVYRFPLDVFK